MGATTTMIRRLLASRLHDRARHSLLSMQHQMHHSAPRLSFLHGERPLVEQWRDLPGRRRGFSAAPQLLAPEAEAEEGVKRLTWRAKIAATALILFCGFRVAGDLAEAMVKHSVALVRMKDPFFQRSGAYRLSLIAMDDKRRCKIVEAGGVSALADLAARPDLDERTLKKVMRALAQLALCEKGVEGIRDANMVTSLEGLASSAVDKDVMEDVVYILGRLKGGLDS